MATFAEVQRIALGLPETEEEVSRDGLTSWRVRGKLFAWERPLRRADLAELGEPAPTGPILCVSVPDLGAKDALITDEPGVYFTTSHFDGYRAVLLQLDRISVPDLTELVVEAWLARAPKRLGAAYLAGQR